MVTIPMTEIQALVEKVLSNDCYSLDMNGCDVSAIIENAVAEQMPKHYTEDDRRNFELELGSELDALYDEYFELEDYA